MDRGEGEVKRFRRTRTRLQTSVGALVAAALVATTALIVVSFNSTPASALIPGTDFTITSTISSSSISQSAATLYPGAQRYLWYNVSNPLTVSITVTSLSILAVTPPSGCATSNLNYGRTTFSGFLVVPASGTNSVSVPISLYDLPTSQNNASSSTENCVSKTFTFTFTGTAQYTALTTTVLTATPMSPAVAGQPVTLSAAVSTSTAGATTPVGSVIFYSCTSLTCATKTALGSAVSLSLNSSGIATTITSPATTGSYYYEAIYTPSNSTNFTPSTSNVVFRLVNYTNACGASGKINGSYTVGSGQFIFANCSVNGGVTVQSGGALFLQGATVNGGVTSTNAGSLMICGSTINSGVTATGTTGFGLIGDGGDDGTPACAANTIKGGVTINNGKGGFEIAGSSITGGVSVAGNTGTGPITEDAAPEIEGNSITGALSCATSNSPVLSNGGQKNTVTGMKSGQCSAAGF